MYISFPTIKKDEKENIAYIKLDDFRIGEEHKNVASIEYQIKYPSASLQAQWSYVSIPKDYGVTNSNSNIIFNSNNNNFEITGVVNNNYAWDIDKRWECRVYNCSANQLLMQIYYMQNGQEKILFEERMSDLIGITKTYRINIHPTSRVLENVYIRFWDAYENLVDLNGHIWISVAQNNYITQSYGSSNKEKLALSYNTCYKNGRADFIMRVILKDSNGNILNMSGDKIEGIEYTTQKIQNLDYIPSINEDPIDFTVYLTTTDRKPAHQVYNRDILKYNWENRLVNINSEDFYQYEIIPQTDHQSGAFEVFNLEEQLKNNAHLEKYRVKEPVYVKPERYAHETELNGFEGLIYSNYTTVPDISFGLPLPVDISNKDTTNIQKWSGEVAETFAGGTGEKDDPYIISSPEELAKAIYEPPDEVYYTYYKVDPSCYAFDMGGSDNVDLYSKHDFSSPKLKWGRESEIGLYGSFDGSGIVIYNLYTEQGGLFPTVILQSEIKNIILKNSCISTVRSYMVYGLDRSSYSISSTGGIIGYFNPLNVEGEKQITLSSCAVMQTQIKGVEIAAGLIGDAGYADTNITNCCCYYNTFVNREDGISIGGMVGTFRSGADNGGGRVKLTGSVIIGNNAVPLGYRQMHYIAHWGMCKVLLSNNYGSYWRQCDLKGEELKSGQETFQLNPSSCNYHFFEHMVFNNCYADIEHYSWNPPYNHYHPTQVKYSSFSQLKQGSNISNQLYLRYDDSIWTAEKIGLLKRLRVHRGNIYVNDTAFLYSGNDTFINNTMDAPTSDNFKFPEQKSYMQVIRHFNRYSTNLFPPKQTYDPIPSNLKYFNIDLSKYASRDYTRAGDTVCLMVRGYHKGEDPNGDITPYGVPYRLDQNDNKINLQREGDNVVILDIPQAYLKPNEYARYQPNKAQSYVKHYLNEDKTEWEYRPITKIMVKNDKGEYVEAF